MQLSVEQRLAPVWDGTRRMGKENFCPVLLYLPKQLAVLGRTGLVVKFLAQALTLIVVLQTAVVQYKLPP